MISSYHQTNPPQRGPPSSSNPPRGSVISSASSDSTTPAVVVANENSRDALRTWSQSTSGPGPRAYDPNLSYISYPQTQTQTRTRGHGTSSSVTTTSTSTTKQKQRQRDDAPLPRRTLSDVHQQVAQETAIRVITKAEVVDGCRIGVLLSMGDEQSEGAFLRLVMEHLNAQMRLRFGGGGGGWIFILADGSPHPLDMDGDVVSTGRYYLGGIKPNVLFILGSTDELVQRAALLTSAKFIGRVVSAWFNDEIDDAKSHINSLFHPQALLESPIDMAPGTLWTAMVRDLGESTYDDAALWDAVRKAARSPIDPLQPPAGSVSIDQMLAAARAKLQRVTPIQAFRELKANGQESQSALTLTTATHTTTRFVSAPAILVDIRPKEQREKHGQIQGALCIERNVLEWRLDPRSDARLPIADRYDIVVIIFCQEGYTSSLAAYSLQQLGLLNATDIIGGFEAWKLAGLSVETPEQLAEMKVMEREQRSLASRAGSVV